MIEILVVQDAVKDWDFDIYSIRDRDLQVLSRAGNSNLIGSDRDVAVVRFSENQRSNFVLGAILVACLLNDIIQIRQEAVIIHLGSDVTGGKQNTQDQDEYPKQRCQPRRQRSGAGHLQVLNSSANSNTSDVKPNQN